jgi:hypothetical protein
MPTTDVRIINQGFSHIGHTIFIDARTENTNEVDVANQHYDDAIAFVLERYEWGFARRIVALGLVTDFTALTTPQDWDYAYRYPVDTVTVRRIVNGAGRQDPDPPPFEIGSDDTGRLVFANQADAIVETTKLITDTALYPAMFAEAVSWWLGFLMAPGLSKEPSIAANCFKVFEQLVAMAAASDGNESRWSPVPYESDAIRARS